MRFPALILVSAVLAAAFALGACGEMSADPGGPIVWRTDLAAAEAEAATSGRPLMVVFR